ncbi:hypothetical protein GP486_001938 [Trichoglossum hirsutum]|uniref:Uncharacterized protein n=1 Tax=Trichoglossum hirsutum TaxID=265104 RepID=A0A9P8RS58_9PEZI|nr:hypothetical protein GP486_001938 [Trichoglossum hirsutum]
MVQCHFTILHALLIDLHPKSPSAAQASSNIIRYELAAACLAVLQAAIDGIGVGWCFTVLAGFCALCYPLTLIERRRGMTWRKKRETSNK